jgi:pimeloyl-ACP methyl ester carboxylesterase
MHTIIRLGFPRGTPSGHAAGSVGANGRPRRLQALILAGWFIGALLLLSGCATPVGVNRLEPREAYRELTASVLSSARLSAPSLQIINRSGLADTYRKDPAAAIATLHQGLLTAREADRLFALAELSFLHATDSDDRRYFLSAAIYAHAFLFPRDPDQDPTALDPRLRTAADIYNQGLSRGFSDPADGRVVFQEGSHPLPFGRLDLRVGPEEFHWGSYRLVRLVDATELKVRGLRNRYRWPGLGAPLVAELEPLPGVEASDYARVPPALRVAATAFLHLENVEASLPTGQLTGRLSLYTTQRSTSVDVGGRRVPLEYGLSAALANTLEGSRAYSLELRGLLSGDLQLMKETARFKDNVFLMEPYRPGRIPVVLVHGTASSPARWAELLNELQNDPDLWGRYQFWLFTYNTGNPILYSGGLLTAGLRQVIQDLDPEGRDPALRRMVVIGHSQGGLLTKLTVVDSANRLWDNAFRVPLDQLGVDPETRELLRRSMFYEPLPFVRRVVFIATPHRGSYVSGGWIGRLTSRLIELPETLASPLTGILQRSPEALAQRSMKTLPRSTDNMAPLHPLIQAFAPIPIVPGVAAHSIIAVDNLEDPREEWLDGVVAYSSAHLEGAASEFIVASGHSCQANPLVIEEVRRILREHLEKP